MMFLFRILGILNGSAPVMIPGSDNISPQANSPLGVMNGGNDNRENVSLLILKQLGRVLVLNLLICIINQT